MKIIWTPQAEQDRDEIWRYIAADNPLAAARMDDLFSEAAAALAHFPLRGRIGRVSGTREVFPNANYCLIYQVEEPEIWILALVHTARHWPPLR